MLQGMTFLPERCKLRHQIQGRGLHQNLLPAVTCTHVLCCTLQVHQMPEGIGQGARIQPPDSAALSSSTALGDLTLLEQPHAQSPGCIPHDKCFLEAAANAQLPVLKWLMRPARALPTSVIQQSILRAAHGSHLDTLSWLCKHFQDGPALCDTALLAASAGDLGAVRALWSMTDCRGDEICQVAACAGHLHVLDFLHQHECPGLWTQAIVTAAAQNGQLGSLQWLHERWPEASGWNASVCSSAASGGCQKVLMWLRDQKVPWDESTCEEAAGNGVCRGSGLGQVSAASMPLGRISLQCSRTPGAPGHTAVAERSCHPCNHLPVGQRCGHQRSNRGPSAYPAMDPVKAWLSA